jgi:beta-lactamase regulating signal transducer with metallopeptidase domain
MTASRPVAILLVAIAAVTCSVRANPCAGVTSCTVHAEPHPWFSAPIIAALLLLLPATALLIVRASRDAVRLQRRVRDLRPKAPVPALRAALRRVDLDRCRVTCVEGHSPIAFCSGLLRPSIYISTALIARLRPAELDAVLLHEAHHAHVREPLRRLLAVAVADAFFYLPLVRWWTSRRAERSELAADAVAVRQRGRGAVAGALCAVDDPMPLAAVSFYGSTLEQRVAVLLDDPVPTRRPTPSIWTRSALGLGAALMVALCVAEEALNHVI